MNRWKQAEVSKALCNDNIQTYGQETACPFDLDEPAKVWKWCPPGGADVEACYISKQDAIRFLSLPLKRQTYPGTQMDWGDEMDEPYEIPLASLLEIAKALGTEIVVLCSGSGQVIEEYHL